MKKRKRARDIQAHNEKAFEECDDTWINDEAGDAIIKKATRAPTEIDDERDKFKRN